MLWVLNEPLNNTEKGGMKQNVPFIVVPLEWVVHLTIEMVTAGPLRHPN